MSLLAKPFQPGDTAVVTKRIWRFDRRCEVHPGESVKIVRATALDPDGTQIVAIETKEGMPLIDIVVTKGQPLA